MLQLIDKQTLLFDYDGNNFYFVKPNYLLPKHSFKMKKATTKGKGSTLYWYIFGTEISYNKLKKLIKNGKKM